MWVNDQINLGTDTVGNYVSSVTAGTGISVNFAPGEGVGASVSLNATLDNLSDVSVATPTGGYVLTYDDIGLNWVAAAVQPPAKLDDIGDVKAGSPSGGDLLKYDGGTSEWKNGTLALDELNNVVAPSPAYTNPLIWNGTEWASGSQELTLGVPGTTDYLTISTTSGVSNSTLAGENFTVGPSGLVATDGTGGPYVNLNANNVTFSNGTDSFMIDPYWATSGQVLAFTPGAGSSGTWGPTTPTLDFLSDVSAASPSAGNVLTYNGSAWTAASAASGGASLEVSATAPASPEVGDLWFNSATLETYIYYDSHWLQASGEPDLVEDLTDLSDVTLTTPVNGQFLKFDGTRWVNGTIPTINTLDDIGDVSVPSPSSGQFLKWNGTAWVAETIIGGATISDTAPASPLAGQLWFQSTNGKTFVYYDSSWIEVGGVGTGARMVSSSSAPASPLEGSMWFDTDTAQTFVYYDSQWIEIGASGVTASVQDSAPAAPVSGQIWFNSLTGGTYVYYGTNWIEVGASPFSALVNTINAKGDLLVGTADNTIGGLTAGSANQVLTVDSSTATGLKWATPVSTGKAIAMSIVFGG